MIGNDLTVTFAAEADQLQLNAFEPIIAYSLFKSVTHLTQACLTLEERCIRGLTANRTAMRAAVERSIGIVTALNPYIGYANATAVAQEAHATDRGVYEVVLEKGLLAKEQLDVLLHPDVLTRLQQIFDGQERRSASSWRSSPMCSGRYACSAAVGRPSRL